MGKSTEKMAPGETGSTPDSDELTLSSTVSGNTPVSSQVLVDPMDATVDAPASTTKPPQQDGESVDDSDEGSTMDLPHGGSSEDYSGVGFLRSSPGLSGSHSPSQSGAFPVANWDRYEILQLLGRGGMGAVYKKVFTY